MGASENFQSLSIRTPNPFHLQFSAHLLFFFLIFTLCWPHLWVALHSSNRYPFSEFSIDPFVRPYRPCNLFIWVDWFQPIYWVYDFGLVIGRRGARCSFWLISQFGMIEFLVGKWGWDCSLLVLGIQEIALKLTNWADFNWFKLKIQEWSIVVLGFDIFLCGVFKRVFMDEVSSSGRRMSSDESPSSSSGTMGWCPRQLVFRPYSSLQETVRKPKSLRVVVRRPVSLWIFLLQLNTFRCGARMTLLLYMLLVSTATWLCQCCVFLEVGTVFPYLL